jgi:glycogen operon protein
MQTGNPYPLGAHWDGKGINFAVFSQHATAIEICFFDDAGASEIARFTLPVYSPSKGVWHGYLPVSHSVSRPHVLYGLRAHGVYAPEQGHRFDSDKILLDPYAREVVPVGAYFLGCIVENDHDFAWEEDRPPAIPIAKTVLYELHLKGFSQSNPAIPATLRGTYAGLAHPASLHHLKKLGVTALSLLPVHYSVDEDRLVRMGLSNYWGYNTLAFFAPSARLAAGNAPRDEFRAMVKAIHAQGMEVILDVVFNHTAETDEKGATLSFRGLDNASYYRLQENNKTYYENHAGCGNTLDIRQPCVLQLVMDSLRYWVSVMHVDGFRFDLATVLGRANPHHGGFDNRSAFFTAIAQDPILSRVKLIVEPWDIGAGGYQVGNFPAGWLEWNDNFRDTVRRYWLHQGQRGALAMRLCGSSDRFHPPRLPCESVNYIVSHDGFTLHDLVSYQERHNHANGESNRDGHGDNISTNFGVEGETDDFKINRLRARMKRALLATNLLAQGTPMLCAGDELGHTQNGNNNPYCQDNATTWIDWTQADHHLIAFTAHVLHLRKHYQPLGNQWLTEQDVIWFLPNGNPLQASDWNRLHDGINGNHGTLGCWIRNASTPLLLLFNPEAADCHFTLPAGGWSVLLDTRYDEGQAPAGVLDNARMESLYTLHGYSLALLRCLD